MSRTGVQTLMDTKVRRKKVRIIISKCSFGLWSLCRAKMTRRQLVSRRNCNRSRRNLAKERMHLNRRHSLEWTLSMQTRVVSITLNGQWNVWSVSVGETKPSIYKPTLPNPLAEFSKKASTAHLKNSFEDAKRLAAEKVSHSLVISVIVDQIHLSSLLYPIRFHLRNLQQWFPFPPNLPLPDYRLDSFLNRLVVCWRMHTRARRVLHRS